MAQEISSYAAVLFPFCCKKNYCLFVRNASGHKMNAYNYNLPSYLWITFLP